MAEGHNRAYSLWEAAVKTYRRKDFWLAGVLLAGKRNEDTTNIPFFRKQQQQQQTADSFMW